MKFTTILFIALSFLLLSCNSKSQNVEKELYDCMMNALTDREEEKFVQIIDEFEKHLINKGALQSTSAESYWRFYEKIAETGSHDYSNDFNLFEKINFLNKR